MDKIEILHELCKALMEELETIAEKIRKGGMSAGDLETVDKLSHALKSIKTTIAMMEADEGYSEAYMPRMSYEGRSYNDGRSYEGRSYARGRQRRDSMGRYSRRGYSYADSMDDLLDEMREMLPDLPDEKRRKAEKLMDELAH